MKKAAVFIGYLLVVILIVVLYFHFNLGPPKQVKKEISSSTSSPVQEFKIIGGEGIKEIAEKLNQGGIIKNKAFFEIYAFLKNAKNKFWPGEYQLNPKMNLGQIIDILTSQPERRQETIIIIEGWTNKQVIDYLQEEALTDQEDFLAAEQEIISQGNYDFLADKSKEVGLQGYLFPDTYQVYKQTTAKEIIKKMLDNFGRKLTNDDRDEIKKQGKIIFQVITLASLVEKEAANDLDRRIIADIFLSSPKSKFLIKRQEFLPLTTLIFIQAYRLDQLIVQVCQQLKRLFIP